MADQATVEPDDMEAIFALLAEKGGPLPIDVLVEQYVARLKERVSKEAEAAAANS